jgi:pimeloyl-ACP methyl ester carboxylesterase
MADSVQRQVAQIQCPHPGGTHRVTCHLWGWQRDAAVAPAVLCVHGLSRNARDFDAIAERLAASFCVACVDMPGRGGSDRLDDPALYSEQNYLADLKCVMAGLGLRSARWIGTSMGGLLGMKMAAVDPARVAALVLNDVGAVLDGAELSRLRRNSTDQVSFDNLEQAEAWCRVRYAEFGHLSAARWRSFAETSVERSADGRLRPCFDARAVSSAPVPPKVDLWNTYKAVRCPTLVIRGAKSALLSRATCEAMATCGPRARWIEVPDAGHAPDLSLAELNEEIFRFIEASR